MKLKLYLFRLLPFMLFSCDKEEEVAPSPIIDSYERSFMVSSNGDGQDQIYHSYSLQHDNSGRVTRRGWKIRCQLSVCDPYESGIYDTIVYHGNTVRLTSLSRHPELTVRETETLIKLNKANQPDYKVLWVQDIDRIDSVRYFYSGKGQLDSLTQYVVFSSGNYRKENTKKFTFDAQGNLSEIETRNYRSNGKIASIYTNIFGDYDTTPNPLRQLYMFDDTFYRSLSKNNFRSHQTKLLDVDDNTTYLSHKNTWQLKYDERGIPLFKR
ncbi:hypothetical protein [Rufibacter quisquiliarum]|uniref:DUF4595 domain-containing protein n=1 Tax=Rufibacter quisquiliarum TaxID=1549639 RepID=A0A839GRD8_9BACT|nr:hypothetical protein [Rufibacter quisquiliarum]MBA9077447.1 hypothetical protein [Rufibacter quisquiliarum]